ncbi:3-mercaptopyruvate sulfurtransferase [Thraustotheca clavata]|uniref:Sulfurtransferase n=1 Tax=Thraustotheca clavata TaxID=74557 RepID=A0A1V9ZRE7_9STRA|nr:3-mercaptopyruvate sulfurtransferase [Thraustotheca clavata]
MLRASSATRRMMSTLSPLLTGSQVESLVSSGKSVRFVDASWYLDKNRNGHEEYLKERIPGAVFFDIDGIKDDLSTLPHMLPSANVFESAMTNFGISNDDAVVVYGGPNCFSPARCWWTFKYFGHDQVHVLNGGFNRWKEEGREVEQGSPMPVAGSSNYTAKPNPRLVLNAQQTNNQIIDARSPGRFYAKDPEPRPGVRGGHMPGALNTPFSHVLTPEDFSVFRESIEIRENFEISGVRLNDTTLIATTCGSGVTASVLTFGLHLLGIPLERVPVYDGSWSEWGASSDLPVTQEQ